MSRDCLFCHVIVNGHQGNSVWITCASALASINSIVVTVSHLHYLPLNLFVSVFFSRRLTMLHRIFALLALAAVTVFAAGLGIKVTHTPETCNLKSRKGDRMSMQ